jgi:hypothetical protein
VQVRDQRSASGTSLLTTLVAFSPFPLLPCPFLPSPTCRTWEEWLALKKTAAQSHLAVAIFARDKPAGVAAAKAGEKAPLQTLSDEQWELFLRVMITARDIKVKVVSDGVKYQHAAGGAAVVHEKHSNSLGYQRGEPVPVPAEHVAAERTRRLKFETAILKTFWNGGAVLNTQGLGEAGVVQAWPFAPQQLRDAQPFAGLEGCVMRCPRPPRAPFSRTHPLFAALPHFCSAPRTAHAARL